MVYGMEFDCFSLSIKGGFTGRFYKSLTALLPYTEMTGARPLELLTVHLAVTSRSSIDIQRKILRNELHVSDDPLKTP